MTNPTSSKEEYAKITCLFLAEQLRVRKITLKRVGEIAEKVATHINLINTERDFAALIKELSKDFEELLSLGERLQFRMQVDERRSSEQLIKQFAIQILASDPHLALNIMQEAAKEPLNLNLLANKFPDFKEFIERQYNVTNQRT